MDREREVAGQDLLVADAERLVGGWVGHQALDKPFAHSGGNKLGTGIKQRVVIT